MTWPKRDGVGSHLYDTGETGSSETVTIMTYWHLHTIGEETWKQANIQINPWAASWKLREVWVESPQSLCVRRKRDGNRSGFCGAVLWIDKKRSSKLITELAEGPEKEQCGAFSEGISQLEYSVWCFLLRCQFNLPEIWESVLGKQQTPSGSSSSQWREISSVEIKVILGERNTWGVTHVYRWGERKRIIFVPGAMLSVLPCSVLKTVQKFYEVVNCISDLLHNKSPLKLVAFKTSNSSLFIIPYGSEACLGSSKGSGLGYLHVCRQTIAEARIFLRLLRVHVWCLGWEHSNPEELEDLVMLR